MEKIFHVNGNEKKGEAGIALFTPAKSLKQPRRSSLDERIEGCVCVWVGVCVCVCARARTMHWGVTQL